MSALADIAPASASLSRRERAARTVDAALRGGLVWTAVSLVAWFVAVAISGTAFFLLLIATALAAVWALFRGTANLWLWGSLAAAWAVVALERWAVNENGGAWVGAAAWVGIVLGARRAGISKWALPLLAYPLAYVVLLVIQGESVLDPWGVSWLWVAAMLGPVIGARTLLRPSQAASASS